MAVAALPLAVAGCASMDQKVAQASQVQAADDPFKPHREYATGEVASGNSLGLGAKKLIAQVDKKSGAATFLLRFQIVYTSGHPRHYDSARNNRAEQLALRTIQRQGQCRIGNDCPYGDLFEVVLPEAHLRSAGPGGYPIKVFARNGPEIVIDIPQQMISALLARVDADRAGGSTVARRA
jgi:hypothetical protein